MKVVVTGASGFLGQAILRALAETPNAEAVGVSRRACPAPRNAETVQVDDYRKSPSGDVLVHLAEPNIAGTLEGWSDAQIATQAALFRDLAEAYPRVVYSSSTAVYGDWIATPRRPDEAATPRGGYGRLKAEGESIALARNGAAARIANVYGLGMPSANVVADVLSQIPGEGAVIVRNLKSVREFIWIDDAAEGLARLALSNANGVFNLGTGVATEISELCRIALDLAGQGERPVQATAELTRASTVNLDISETTRVLGWTPQVSLREGLGFLMRNADEQARYRHLHG
jgi:UDP-glucose 4-epimerase